MRATPTSSHLDHKAVKRPDTVMVMLRKVFGDLSKRSRELTMAGIALVAGAALALVYLSHRESTSSQAGDAFFEARQLQEKEFKALALKEPRKTKEEKKDAKKGKDAKAVEPAEDLTQPSPEQLSAAAHKSVDLAAAYPESFKALRKVADDFSNTRAGFEAKVALGNLYYSHGHTKESIEWFGKAAAGAPSAMEESMALYSLGVSLENEGQTKDALAAFQKGLNSGQAALKGEFLLAKGRCHETLKEPQLARETYKRVTEELKDTGYARSASARLAVLGN